MKIAESLTWRKFYDNFDFDKKKNLCLKFNWRCIWNEIYLFVSLIHWFLASSSAYFMIFWISSNYFWSFKSVIVKSSNLLSRPLLSLLLPILLSWISVYSENHGCWRASSRVGLFCLFFSSSSMEKC